MRLFAAALNRVQNIDLPLLVLELRRTQRGTRPFWRLFFYTLIVSGVALGAMGLIPITSRAIGHWGIMGLPGLDQSFIGKGMFIAIVITQLTLISLGMPALTARAISSEKENRTLEILSLTLMSSWSIVNQKLLSALAQVGMLVLASLPILAIVFMFGGVSPLEVVLTYALLMISAAFYGALGLLCSSLCESSRTAVLVAYLVIFFGPHQYFNPAPFVVFLLFTKSLMPVIGMIGPFRLMSIWGSLCTSAACIAISGAFIMLLTYASARKLESMRRS